MKNLMVISRLLTIIITKAGLISLGGLLALIQWSILVSIILTVNGVGEQVLSSLSISIGGILMMIAGPKSNESGLRPFMSGFDSAFRTMSVSDLCWPIKFAFVVGPFGAFARLMVFLETL